jgi:hypothetical protein
MSGDVGIKDFGHSVAVTFGQRAEERLKPGGQCYDNYFRRFSQFATKMSVFVKLFVLVHELLNFESNSPIFSPSFGQNIDKIGAA